MQKLNERQAFDFITDKPANFSDELNQLETYTFSVYSDDLWDYEPQANTDEFVTYLLYTYKDKWQTIYENDLQNFGSNFTLSKNNNKNDNSNYIQTNDGIKAVLSGEEKTTTNNKVTSRSVNINKIQSFFTIVLDDVKKEILLYKGE